MQDVLSDSAAENHVEWDRLRPLLDDALHELDRRDREVLLMRFFQGRRFAEIGAKLRLGEDAARMRTERALEKLRGRLAQRSITSTTAALGIALASQPAIAVPAGLAASVTGVALAGVAAGAGIGGAAALSLFFMQTKTTVAAAIAVLALGFAVYELNSASREREAADVLARERDALQAQVRGLEQRVAITDEQNAVLQRDLQAARAAKLTTPLPPPAKALSTPSGGLPSSVWSPAVGATFSLRSSSGDPEEMRRQMRINKGQNLDTAYAAFYRTLNLTPAQREQFKELMLDQDEKGEKLLKAATDAARAQNPSFDRADFFEIVEVTRAQIETDQQADVRRLFGDAAGQALERYQATAGMRAIAKQLASALFSSEAPITPAQAEQLIEIMANHARGPNGRIEIGALNTGAALAQAQGLLNPFQLAELQRVATRVQEQAKAELERNTAPAASLKQAAK